MKAKEKEIISLGRKCGDLQGADIVIGGFARKILGKKAFIEADIIHNWRDIVGKDLAELAKPVCINFKGENRKGGVLNVEAASGAIALEINLKSKMIIAKVNTYFGYEAIDRIKIMQNLKVVSENVLASDNLEKKLVTDEQENYIKRQTEEIAAPELRESLRELGRALMINNS